jgi:hypothetical protein
MNDLPAYDELPLNAAGHRSAWHLFGSDDSVGLFNLQTPDTVRAAATLIRTGQVFALNASVDALDPPLYGRKPVRHTLIGSTEQTWFDDVLDDFYPQISSQWDALAHAAYDADTFYNDARAADIADRRVNTIEHWARRGIAGRAVLLDVEAVLRASTEFNPGTATRITA